jgi:hypothetical protein
LAGGDRGSGTAGATEGSADGSVTVSRDGAKLIVGGEVEGIDVGS